MRMSDRLPLAGIDCAILVGGLGTRLSGVVNDVPKPMAPVLGRPFLFYLLDLLALRGARSVVLCSGYLAELVRNRVGDSWLGMPVHHSVETQPLGTGGALARARPCLNSEKVLVMNGDTWFEPNFKEFIAAADGSECCIAAAWVSEGERYGALEWDDKGRITSFKEKSKDGGPAHINAGVYFISQDFLAGLPDTQLSLENQVLPAFVLEGRVRMLLSDAAFLDIGIPGDYAAAGKFFTDLEVAPHRMFPDNPAMEEAMPKLGACAVIIDHKGRIAFERRSDCGWWCLPGGGLNAGETIAQGAIREAFEETGLEVRITGFLGVFSDPRRRTVCYPDNGDLRQLVDAAVLAEPIGGQLAQSDESLEVAWFALDRIPLNTAPPVVEILRCASDWHGSSVLR